MGKFSIVEYFIKLASGGTVISYMKRSELIFSFLLVPIDYIMLILAGFSVYMLRYDTFLTEIRPIIFEISLPEYIVIVAVVALIWLPIFAFAGMYTITRPRRLVDEFTKVILGCSTGLIAIVFFIFFRHELFGSRFIVLFGWLGAIVFVFLGRVIIRSVQRSLYKRGTGVLRVVLVGSGQTAYSLEKAIKEDPKAGYKVVRHLRTLDDASRGLLLNIAKNNGADMVLQADYGLSSPERAGLLRFCQENHLDFSYASDTLEAAQHNIEMQHVGGVPLVHIKRTPLDGWGRIAKRIMDIAFACLAMLVIAPISVILGIAIKLDSRGPVLVRLARVGERGKKFILYKFRSMVAGAHAMKPDLKMYNERTGGPLFKMKHDPRITKVGKVIRKWSLDELPNFFNVIRGDLSLVGPRPHEPEEVGKYESRQRRLLNIKPGVTGLAQISGRSDLDFEEEARLDLFYIENWSLWLDIKILIRTPWVVIRGKSAV